MFGSIVSSKKVPRKVQPAFGAPEPFDFIPMASAQELFIRDPTKAVPGVFRRTYSLGWRPNIVLPKDVMVSVAVFQLNST